MNDFMVNMALNHFGFDDDQKARILAFLPKAAYIAALVKSHKTLINETIDIIEMVTKQVAKTEAAS